MLILPEFHLGNVEAFTCFTDTVGGRVRRVCVRCVGRGGVEAHPFYTLLQPERHYEESEREGGGGARAGGAGREEEQAAPRGCGANAYWELEFVPACRGFMSSSALRSLRALSRCVPPCAYSPWLVRFSFLLVCVRLLFFCGCFWGGCVCAA